MVYLVRNPIEPSTLLERVQQSDCGGVVLFLGTVRDLTDGRQTTALDYEAYPPMAERKLAEIEQEVRTRWPVRQIAMIHRLGHLEIGEISVAIAVSCPHRAQAFEACQYAIDRLKQIVPIWKKEHWADQSSTWIHPGAGAETSQPSTPHTELETSGPS